MSKERPTEQQRKTVAENIRAGGVSADNLAAEELGLRDGGGKMVSIVEEAKLEESEGGGPIASAKREFDQKTADSVDG